MGLDIFGIGEHYRKEFLDVARSAILAAAAARTAYPSDQRCDGIVRERSGTALSRVRYDHLISRGREGLTVGTGSFVQTYPLAGLKLAD